MDRMMKKFNILRFRKRFIGFVTGLLAVSVFLSGCNLISLLYPEATPTVLPTPTPEPIRTLNVCLGYEPRSLYPFKAVSAAEQEVLRAITDGPIDILASGEKIPVLLKSMPTVDDGSITYTPVAVTEGDVVANSFGDLVALETGVSVFPSGCTSAGCVLNWDGVSPLQLDQLTITFSLKDGLLWSDGSPLTADDSVFGFELAGDPATPNSKKDVDLTVEYTAADDNAVRWTAVPGFVTDEIERFFWSPMPRHAWGEINAGALLDVDTANRTPLSYGPFMIEEWIAGDLIRLVKNPYYHRAVEGLPTTDVLVFKFLSVDDPASLLAAASAECDLVSSSELNMADMQYLDGNAGSAGMRVLDQVPDVLEMVAVGITPYSYDDNYYPFGADRPDVFGDARTRQALAYCLDAQAIVDKLLGGAAETANAILPRGHRLLADASLTDYTVDPARAVELLRQVGWADADFNPDTPLTALNVLDVPPGTTFEVELLTSQSALRGELAAEIAAQLFSCGIKVNITQLPLNDLYQSGPEGRIFGRNFDLALLSMQIDRDLNCGHFTSMEIPSDANYWLGERTGGANFYGFQSNDYDALCAAAMQSGLDADGASAALQSALEMLNTDLPLIPLFFHPKGMLVRDDVCGLPGSASAQDVFRYIENLAVGAGC